MTRSRTLFAMLFVAGIPAIVVAQQSTDGPYVLHELVNEVRIGGADGAGGAAADGTEPRAADSEFFKSGEPPALSLEARPGEPVYDRDGPVFERDIQKPYGELSPYASANTLDERTDRVNSLTYFSNFDPSIIPYKRVVVKNHATLRNGEYALDAFTTGRRNVERVPEQSDDDMFWGTFLLRLERGKVHPIASISPDQRVVDWIAEPDVPLVVERDDADNYFVRSERSGLVRLNMRIAVPKFYWGGPFPAVAWTDFPEGVVPPMAPDLAARALGIAQRLGFTKTKPPGETVVQMVEYFRNFEAKPFPQELRGDDLLEAICTEAIGVCRHRSLAFVFLAQSMGIPARYVYNEAHAFVEVYWPVGGWRRLDLGGAANELNASANDGRQVHDPGNDGLPTPQRYLDEQERMEHNGWEPPQSASGQQQAGNGNGNAGTANGTPPDGAMSNAGQPDGAQNGAQDAAPASAEHSNTDMPPHFEEPPPDDRTPSRLVISSASASVRRGTSLALDARLTSEDGRALSGRSVDVYLGPVGAANPSAARKIGTAKTDASGRVRTRVDVPREHAIGRWSLFIYFAGDAHHQPAVAD